MMTASEAVRENGVPTPSGKRRNKHARFSFCRALALFLLLLAVSAFAQDGTIVTNLADLAQGAFSGEHSIYLPFEPWHWQGYSIDGGQPWWVDFSQFPCLGMLQACTNVSTDAEFHGVPLVAAQLTKNILTGEVLFQSECSSDVLTTVAAPSGYQPGVLSEDRGVWWMWQQAANCLECWGIEGEIPPPVVILNVVLADLQNYGTYQSNVLVEAEADAAAQAAAASAPAMATAQAEDDMMTLLDGGDPCAITSETDPFSIVSVTIDGTGCTPTWASCTDHIYVVQFAGALAQTTTWTDAAWMWGSDGTTSWTDTNAVGQAQMFYRVVRANPTNTNNGIPYSWAMSYGFDPLDPNLAYEDPDNDFLSNLGEYLNGTNPTNAANALALGFTINGGGAVVSNTQVEIEFAPELVADYTIISEDSGFASNLTNQFSPVSNYTLQNTQDGMHTLYVQLLQANGTTSPVFWATVELDTAPPSILITSPTNGAVVSQRRINIEGLAADASTNAPQTDATRWLQVTVNPDLGIGAGGDFVNDRNTNGLWWAGPQDLVASTNTFVVIATDRAGWTATNSVWFIYDPTLATNVPVFTVNVADTVVVGSTTPSFALGGMIDDSNATVRIDLLDTVDNTVTNASVNAAVHDTNWWATILVLPGTNLVIVTAQNSGSLPSSQSFTMIQDTNVFLEITSPLPDATINGTNVTVMGIANLSLSNATITINGEAATISVGASNITFTSTNPVPLGLGANAIQVQVTGSGSGQMMRLEDASGGSGDPPPPTATETVYGYEVLAMNWHGLYYSHAGGCAETLSEFDDWDTSQGGTYHEHVDEQSCDHGSSSSDYNWPISFDCGLPNGDVCLSRSFGCIGDWSFTWPCSSYYCGNETDYLDLKLTIIKHAPTDDEQTVVFHFDGLGYYYLWNVYGPVPAADPSAITFRGAKGFWHIGANGQPDGLAFVIKIRPNTPFTIQASDFQFPTLPDIGPSGYGYSHYMSADGFGNFRLWIDGQTNLVYLCSKQQQTSVTLTAHAESNGQPYTSGTYDWSIIAGANFVQLETTSKQNVVKVTPKAPSQQADDVKIAVAFQDPYGRSYTTTNNVTVLTPWGVRLVSQVRGDLGSGVGFTNACVYQVVNQLPDHGPLRAAGLNVHEDFPVPAPPVCTMSTGDFPTDRNGCVGDLFRVAGYCLNALNFTMTQRLIVDCATNCHDIVCTESSGIDVKEFTPCQ